MYKNAEQIGQKQLMEDDYVEDEVEEVQDFDVFNQENYEQFKLDHPELISRSEQECGNEEPEEMEEEDDP